MTKLSQAERTAIVEAFNGMGVWSEPFFRAEQMWFAGRDYGRERERTLEARIDAAFEALGKVAPALDALGRALFEGDPLDELRLRFSDIVPEIEAATAQLKASLGEPEGQCTWCDNKRVLMEPDGSKLQRCPHCHPDHGPGEPSEALKRLKSWRDILERQTALESRENDEQVEVEGRVLHNLKQAIDAVLVGESNG